MCQLSGTDGGVQGQGLEDILQVHRSQLQRLLQLALSVKSWAEKVCRGDQEEGHYICERCCREHREEDMTKKGLWVASGRKGGLDQLG